MLLPGNETEARRKNALEEGGQTEGGPLQLDNANSEVPGASEKNVLEAGRGTHSGQNR